MTANEFIVISDMSKVSLYSIFLTRVIDLSHHSYDFTDVTEKSGENNQLLALKNQICKNLRISAFFIYLQFTHFQLRALISIHFLDDETFQKLMNESNETLQGSHNFAYCISLL